MQYQEFIGRVQQQAGLGSFERAEAATRATLTVLGEYLSGGEGHDLAARLSQGLAELLHRQSPARSFIFSLNDFLQRVGEEEGVESGAGGPRPCRRGRSQRGRKRGRDAGRPPPVPERVRPPLRRVKAGYAASDSGDKDERVNRRTSARTPRRSLPSMPPTGAAKRAKVAPSGRRAYPR